MTEFSSAPCTGSGWAPVWPCDLPTGSAAVTGVALQAATEVLDALTGRHFGVCQFIIRPCRRECYEGDVPGDWWEYEAWPRPLFYNGVWSNLTCGGCAGTCSCTEISEVLLPAPVASVDQVKVDGVILALTDYRVDDWRKLVRLGGLAWPVCNDLNLPDTDVGTWSVTVTVGEAVPALGTLALGVLAGQFVRLLLCDDSCSLPKPVQQLIRQGVVMNFLDPTKLFGQGQVGLYLVDLFVSTVNPNHLSSRSRVYDVDGDNYRITGT